MNNWLMRIAFASTSVLLTLSPVHAAFPEKPIRLVVPFAVGGGTDLQARMIAQQLAAEWGQPVIVDNRAGGGAVIGTNEVARARPDGHTILMASFPHAVNPGLRASLPYDTRKAFTPVTLVSTLPLILVVHRSIAPTSVRELIALAKAKPGVLNYGSSGIGGPQHIAGELFKSMAGIDLLHVEYKGTGQMLPDLYSGEIKVCFVSPFGLRPHIESGLLRAIGITSAEQNSAFPGVPTIAEASGLPGYSVVSWNGVLVPAGTPNEVIKRLHAEITRSLGSPGIKKALEDAGSVAVGNSPAEFARFIDNELRKYGELLKTAGIRVSQ